MNLNLARVYYVFVNAISLILMTFILNKSRREIASRTIEDSLLIKASIYNIVYCITDIIAYMLKGESGMTVKVILYIVNIIYIIVPMYLSWEYSVYFYAKTTGKNMYLDTKFGNLTLAAFVIITLMMISTPFTGFGFTIDDANIYHRSLGGVLVPVVAYLFIFFMIIWSFADVRKNRKFIFKEDILPTLYFAVFPTISLVIQLLLYGISLGPTGITLAILYLYHNRVTGQATTDELTGIGNRRGLYNFIQNHLSRDENDQFIICMLDINDFKLFNDNYGHSVGDDVLRRVADTIYYSVYNLNEFFVARVGGDEFLIAGKLPDYSMIKALKEELREELMDPVSTKAPYSISIAFGYSIGSISSYDDFLKIYTEADRAMYADKVNIKSAK